MHYTACEDLFHLQLCILLIENGFSPVHGVWKNYVRLHVTLYFSFVHHQTPKKKICITGHLQKSSILFSNKKNEIKVQTKMLKFSGTSSQHFFFQDITLSQNKCCLDLCLREKVQMIHPESAELGNMWNVFSDLCCFGEDFWIIFKSSFMRYLAIVALNLIRSKKKRLFKNLFGTTWHILILHTKSFDLFFNDKGYLSLYIGGQGFFFL